MKYITHYLGSYKKESLLAPLFKMLEAIFELLVPIVMAHMIDDGIAMKDRAYILRMCGLLILFACVGLLVAVTAQYFASKAATGAASDMRRDLFHHICDFWAESMEKAGSGTLVTRMTDDINQVQNGMNMFLRLFLRSPFIVFGAMIMAFIVDARTALIFCVIIPALAVVVALITWVTLPLFRKIQKRLDGLLTRVRENLEGVRVIRAFGMRDREIKKFRDETGELCRDQIRAGKASALLNPLTYALVNLGIAAILWAGGIRINSGSLLQGELVAQINYMSQILVELIKLANLIILLVRAFASVGRLQEIADMPADTRAPADAEISSGGKDASAAAAPDAAEMIARANTPAGQPAPQIVFSDVSFAYPDAKISLEHLNFSCRAGESLGIIGGTGSGKTSIIRLLLREYDPADGIVCLDGKNLRTRSDQEIRERISYVPQQAQLFVGTIAENLRMSCPDASDDQLWEALEAAQAREIVEKKPYGLAEPVTRGASNFSGGQRQRLTIARALLKKSGILILDDASSALDLATERRLIDAISHLPWKPTVIMISQRASSVLSFDRILVMEEGKTVGMGPHEQLLSDCEVYREIYYAQFPKEGEAV